MHRLVAAAAALLGSSLSFTSVSIACCTFRATVSPLQLVSESGILWLHPYQDPHHGCRTVSRCFMTMRSRRVYAMSESGAAAVTELVKIL